MYEFWSRIPLKWRCSGDFY